MISKEFELIREARISKIRSSLGAKRAEYATDADVLVNFKSGAACLKTSPEKTLLSYATKHWVSIQDMIENLPIDGSINPNTKEANLEVWNEKVGDVINYLILLEGLIQERLSGK